MLKPQVIKTEEVLNSLFKGNDVLHIFYNSKGVQISSLTKKTLEAVRNIVDKHDSTDFFVEMVEIESSIEPSTGTGTDESVVESK